MCSYRRFPADIKLTVSLRALESKFQHETKSQKWFQQSWEIYFSFKSAFTVPDEVYNFDKTTLEVVDD